MNLYQLEALRLINLTLECKSFFNRLFLIDTRLKLNNQMENNVKVSTEKVLISGFFIKWIRSECTASKILIETVYVGKHLKNNLNSKILGIYQTSVSGSIRSLINAIKTVSKFQHKTTLYQKYNLHPINYSKLALQSNTLTSSYIDTHKSLTHFKMQKRINYLKQFKFLKFSRVFFLGFKRNTIG